MGIFIVLDVSFCGDLSSSQDFHERDTQKNPAAKNAAECKDLPYSHEFTLFYDNYMYEIKSLTKGQFK